MFGFNFEAVKANANLDQTTEKHPGECGYNYVNENGKHPGESGYNYYANENVKHPGECGYNYYINEAV